MAMCKSACSRKRHWKDGRLIGLLAYVILLQGLATAYATTLMATDQFGPSFVICAPSGNADQPASDPLEDVAQKCCRALCKAASMAGPVIEPPASGTHWLVPTASLVSAFPSIFRAVPTGRQGTLPEARGPPRFSI